MTDRLSQYPAFNASMLQQHQQQHLQQQQAQQQQAQQQQAQQQQDPTTFPDQNHVWQQMQHLQQFRPRSGAGMSAPQGTTSAQMAELMRSQNIARVQGQQQQQFGSGIHQMGGGGLGLGQQQGFHDSSSNQPHMSMGFPGIGGMPNTGVNAATLQQRNGSFPPEAVRQFELMGRAHSQQPGPVYAKFNQSQQQRDREFQPQGVNHSSPGDVFSSPNISNEAIRRPSPSSLPSNHVQPMPAVASGSQPQPGMPNSDPRRLTVFDLNTRARGLTQSLAEAERTHQAFAAQIAARGGQVDPMSAQRLTALKTDIMVKKDNLNKVTAMMNSIRAQQGQIQGGGGAGNQASWTLPTASFENNSQPGRPKLGQNPPQQQQQHLNSIQASPSLLKAQASPNHLMPQGAVPTRSVSSPHQQAQPGGQHTGVGGPFANQVAMSGSMGGHSPLAMGGPSGSPGSIQQGQTGMNSFPVPLDKARFEQSFRAYCTRKNLNVNLRQLQIDNRPVELYQLHRNVMLEFGVGKVEQKALWDVIGGRMGFVQFSGTETEPAKSGPGVAQQLAHIYKELLAAFDHYYISSVFEARLKAQAQVPRNPAQMSPQMMQSVLTYAHMSVTELHQRGVPEKIITFVEANRANLQRTYADQRVFQSQLRPTNQNDVQGSGDQNGPSGGGPGQQLPFGGPATQQNSAGHQHFLQQQNRLNLLEGNNFLDNRQPQQRSLQQGPPMPAMRPTKELIEKSQHFVQSVKRMFNTTTIPSMPTVDIPVERQAEYLSLLNTLHAQCQEVEPKLAMFLVFTGKEEPIKRMAAIICTVAQQKSFGGSRFIVTLDMLQKMHMEMKRTMDGWAQRPFAHQPQHSQLNSMAVGISTNDVPTQSRPTVSHPSASLPPPQPQIPSQPVRPQVSLLPPPNKRKAAQPSSAGPVSTPSPAPASTPVAGAHTPTPTAASPQTPKSPKGKASVKPKQPPTKRRPSKAAPPATSSATSDPAQTPVPAVGSSKRPRDEEMTPLSNALSPGDGPFGAANEPSPPKRVKTEWDAPPSDALKKKTEAVENIKTEEDACVFLEQMTELIKKAADGEGQESLSSDLSETLEMILKGYGPTPDSFDGGSSLSLRPELGDLREPSPPAGPLADFEEFFDFSGTIDDDDSLSKAETPELVSSSSTNPSPESNSESDAIHHMLTSSSMIETKREELPDLLRLGPWKEIDGGEAAYYQTSEWKWDSPMPSMEQPWAIFSS